MWINKLTLLVGQDRLKEGADRFSERLSRRHERKILNPNGLGSNQRDIDLVAHF